MPYVNRIKMPSGDIYEIADTTARQTRAGAIKLVGTTTTALTDGATTNPVQIDGANHTAVANDAVLYNQKEFVFDGTKWRLFVDTSELGKIDFLTGGTQTDYHSTEVTENEETVSKYFPNVWKFSGFEEPKHKDVIVVVAPGNVIDSYGLFIGPASGSVSQYKPISIKNAKTASNISQNECLILMYDENGSVNNIYRHSGDGVNTTETVSNGCWRILNKNEIEELRQSKADVRDTVLETTLSRGRKSGSVTGNSSFAFGQDVVASSLSSHAEGDNTTASGTSAHAEGSYTTASQNATHAEGSHTTASGQFAHSEGCGTIAQRKSQHVFGEYNIADEANNANARGKYVVIVGKGNDSNNRSNARTLDWSGNETLAGRLTLGAAPSNDMHATTKQYVDAAILTIANSKADKSNTVLETTLSRGRKPNTITGTGSFAFGNDVTAKGNYSFSEGSGTTANGNNSHAEGLDTTASAANTHAEGYNTYASGQYSHVEGNGTLTGVQGTSAHAEGSSTTASGGSSHSEGSNTKAQGSCSHAEGSYTTAKHKSQHVFGEYNVVDPSSASTGNRGTYVEIVGNGTASNALSNARTLDWSGNEVLAGKLTVGAAPTADMDVTTKQYVDTAISSLRTSVLDALTNLREVLNNQGNTSAVAVLDSAILDLSTLA